MNKIIFVALGTLIFCPSATYGAPKNANGGSSVPTLGDLQTALTAAASSNYKKTTFIASYNGVSGFSYDEKNPLNTNYTQDGLYMVERKSGYYTYNNSIYHISTKTSPAERGVAISDYQTYDAFFRTLKDFSGTYVSSHLEIDTTDQTGYTFKNRADVYSNPDIYSMIFFVAPLVDLPADGVTFSNYSFSFKIGGTAGSYVIYSISIAITITHNENSATLNSSATFSNIGSTELGYTISE